MSKKSILALIIAISLLMGMCAVPIVSADEIVISALDYSQKPSSGQMVEYEEGVQFVLAKGLAYTATVSQEGMYFVTINAGTSTPIKLTTRINGVSMTKNVETSKVTDAQDITIGKFPMNKGSNIINLDLVSGSILFLHSIKVEYAGNALEVDFSRKTGAFKEITLPQKIEAEDFDLGVSGYSVNKTELVENDYREPVAVEMIKKEKGYKIRLEAGEWTKYTFNVEQSDNYNVFVSADSKGKSELSFDGYQGALQFDTKMGEEAKAGVIYLEKGTHSVLIKASKFAMEYDYLRFSASGEKGIKPEELKESDGEKLLSAKSGYRNIYKNLYVESGKTGGDGSKEKPFGSIEEAQSAVKKARENMNGDIVVNIAPGEYELEKALEFTNEDAGKNGFRVLYKGSNLLQKPIISGGSHISGWEKTEHGLWKTTVNNVEDVRQLYIDGNPARRSRTKYDYEAVENWNDPETDSWIDGLYVKKRNFPVMTNKEDLEFVSINDWLGHRAPIADIIDADEERWLIKFEQPYFSNFELTNVNFRPNAGLRFYIENAYELTNQPGEFYFNKKTKEIFYYPYPEEDMTKVDAVIGRTEFMIKAKGTSRDEKMEGLAFENLDFRYGTWIDVNRTGIQATQADCLVPPEGNPYRQYKSGMALPGQLQFTNAKNIVIENCNFQNLGSGAIQMMDYVEDARIEGNTIKDISGTSIMIGGWKTAPELNELKVPFDLCENITVRNNVIERIGIEFYGSPGIAVYYARKITVDHNHIQDVPYSGISMGWGWENNPEPVNLSATDVVFSNNKVINTSIVCRDGGFTYTLGILGNSFIENNYMENSEDYGGLYFDAGSGGWTARNNVVKDAQTWCFLSAPSTHNGINVYDNYTNTECYYELKDVSTGGKVEQATMVSDANWQGAALEIVNNAGVEPGYRHLLKRAEYPVWRTQELQFVPIHDKFSSDYTFAWGANEWKDGGEGVGFHVTGGKEIPNHRPSLFMVAPTIGNTAPGEWLAYDIDVKHAGNYEFELTYGFVQGATNAGDNITDLSAGCNVYLDGVKVIDNAPVPDTGGWTKNIPTTMGEFYMPEGKHEIKFELVGNAYSLQWMKLINIDVETDPMFDECFTE